MKTSFRTWHKLSLLVLLSAWSLLAQSTGRISGSVVDESGGVIGQATATVSNTQTGLTRTLETNQDGVFVFPDLPIGAYTLEFSKTGFQTSRREGINLLTGQSLDLRMVLPIASGKQVVEVTDSAALIQSASSNVETTIATTQMKDLPLNGRNPLQLTALTPGTAITDVGTESGQQDNRGLTVNGLRATQNNFQLDGAPYTNRFFDSVPVMPNPDALEEFTIQSSAYGAEYGGAGALVQLSTRSGSNTFHGTAFEFLRNTDLNARNFFQITRPPFKLNQYGGTIGGPIRRNKTFFFFSGQDGQQRSAPNPISITTPTQAERNGNFAALGKTIIDPTIPGGTTAFAGAQIPTARFDPLSVKLSNLYLPFPNSGTQYISAANKNVDDTQYVGKVDHQISDSNHLSVRYYFDEDNFQRPFNAPNGFYAENLFRNQSLTINDTHTFSPTLTATFYASAGRYARTQIPEAPGLQSLQALGQQVPLGTGVPIFPGIRANISGFANIFSGGALRQDATTFDYRGAAVKVWRGHVLSFGGEFERTRIDANDYSYTPGDNTFNGQVTGSALTDFYLGYESNFFQDNGRTFYLRENRPSAYLQDDWKVNSSVTINAGVRWEPWLPPTDLNNSLTGFEPGVQSTVAPNAPRGLVFPGDPGVQSSIFKQNWKAFAPRAGFAWNVGGNNNTVVRAGYGLFYSLPEGLLYQRTDATQPTDLYLNIPAPQSFSNPYLNYPGGSPFPRLHILPSQFSTYKFLLPLSGGVLDPSSRTGYTQNWNFTVEHRFKGDIAVSAAYIGNHGVDIMGSRQLNPALYYPGATVAKENANRLYPGFGAVEVASAYVYDIYHSLQFSATKRTTKGLTLLTNFVWSKTIDNTSSAAEGNAGPHNPFDFTSARGPADFDQTFRFNLSANYVLPHLAVKGVNNVLLNGWQINTIVALYSGLPFTVVSGTDRSISGIGNDYADYTGASTTGSGTIAQYFNPAAFQLAKTGTFGNVGRNSLRGPGFADVDASIFKNFRFTERLGLQFRAEAFNVQNRANFQNPNATVSTTPTFGKITAAFDPRVLQFGLKLLF